MKIYIHIFLRLYCFFSHNIFSVLFCVLSLDPACFRPVLNGSTSFFFQTLHHSFITTRIRTALKTCIYYYYYININLLFSVLHTRTTLIYIFNSMLIFLCVQCFFVYVDSFFVGPVVAVALWHHIYCHSIWVLYWDRSIGQHMDTKRTYALIIEF